MTLQLYGIGLGSNFDTIFLCGWLHLYYSVDILDILQSVNYPKLAFNLDPVAQIHVRRYIICVWFVNGRIRICIMEVLVCWTL